MAGPQRAAARDLILCPQATVSVHASYAASIALLPTIQSRSVQRLGESPSVKVAPVGQTNHSNLDVTPVVASIQPATSTLDPLVVLPRYFPRLCAPFVGRENELAQLLAPVGAVALEGPQLALLSGEAGMGKTRILVEVAERARCQGALTLAGGCYEQEKGLPYGPIHDALLDLIRTESPDRLHTQLQGVFNDIAKIVPEVRDCEAHPHAEAAGDGEGQRLRLFAATSLFVERVSRDRPLLLLLDDLQWVDDSTLQLIHFLLRQEAPTNLFLLGAYRHHEVPEGSSLALLMEEGRAGREGGIRAHTVVLGALNEQEMDGLLRLHAEDGCPDSVLNSLQARAEGNPFFALQMLELLRDEGTLDRIDGRKLMAEKFDLPIAVRDTITRRVRRLNVTSAQALDLAAIIGLECNSAVLATVWHDDEDILFTALDRCTRAGLLLEVEDGYQFSHHLLREVVYDKVSAPVKRRLHGEVGDALEASYGDRAREHAPELARHFLASKEPQRALPYLIAAGDSAEASYAYDVARSRFGIALDLIGKDDSPTTQAVRAEVLLRLGKMLRLTAQQESTVTTLQEAARLYSCLENCLGELRALVNLAKAQVRTGNGEAAREIMFRIDELLPTLDMESSLPELALLYNELGSLYFRTSRYEEFVAAKQREIALAMTLKDDRHLIRAQVGRAVGLGMLGRLGEAGKLAESLIPRAEELAEPESLRLALAEVAEAAMVGGEFVRSRECRERELVVAESMGTASGTAAYTRANYSQVLLYLGEWEAARAHASRALEELQTMGTVSRSSYAGAYLGEIALRQGKWQEAVQYLEQCVSVAQQAGDFQLLRYAQRLLAEWDIFEGHPTQALARLEPILDRTGLEEHDVTHLLPYLAWAHLCLGGLDRSATLVRYALTRAEAQEHRLAQVDALWVHGMILWRQRHIQDACDTLEQAIMLARQMPYPYAEARVLQEQGTAYVLGDTFSDARICFAQAHDIFQKLGAEDALEGKNRLLTSLQ